MAEAGGMRMRLHRTLGTAGLVITAMLASGAGSAIAAPTAPVLAWSDTLSVAPAPAVGGWHAYRPASALAPLLPAAGPTNTPGSPPSISGNATVGSTLTADAGNWTSSDLSSITYTYQWEDCDPSGTTCNPNGSPVTTSATTTAYQVASGDVGSTIEIQVTAMDDTGTSSPVSSGPTAVVPGPPAGGSPSITGSATVGSTLTANPNPSSWTNNPTSYDYQWESCAGGTCTNVGGDSSTYTVAQSDIGDTLSVAVTANNSAGSSTPALAGPTAVVPGPPAGGSPSISGTAAQGQTLTANPGTWTNNPTSYDYQWKSCTPSSVCSNVGTNSNTYTVAAGDVGNTLDVVVTAINSAGPSSPATSAPTAVVVGLPANTVLPSISGTAAQGQTLTANPGTWTNNPTSYSYQWKSCTPSSVCSNVGTNSNTYTVAAGDVGNTLEVVVTASNAAGSASATSGPTSAVVGLPVNSALPYIVGTAAQGQTLTAYPGTWSGSPTYTYQWQRCYQGRPCSNIGATSATYIVGLADVNASLQVVVTATNAAGPVSATSAATAVVPAVPGSPTASFTLSY